MASEADFESAGSLMFRTEADMAEMLLADGMDRYVRIRPLLSRVDAANLQLDVFDLLAFCGEPDRKRPRPVRGAAEP